VRADRLRAVLGVGVAAAGVVALSGVMLPLRAHLGLATSALVLVVPVVLGVAVGGFAAGAFAVAAGFLAYDILFIPPYGTPSVAAGQDWVALGVYVVVMLTVARIVANLRAARGEARRREEQARELLELSDVLIGDNSSPELLELVVHTVQRAFGLRSAAVLLPRATDGSEPDGALAGTLVVGQPTRADLLQVAASAGVPLDDSEVREVSPIAGEPRSLSGATPGSDGLAWLTLTVAGRPIGVLAIAGTVPAPHDRELLRTYANHAALALERSRLREQAVRSQVAEEADRWRQALLGAVSHDLRTPLATVKAALSDLRREDLALSHADRQELLELAETQSDRLARLVSNLLDMTQIQAGALKLRRRPAMMDELVAETLLALGPDWPGRLATSIPLTLPPVDVDHLLVVQVLANLLDNSVRHAPSGAPIRVGASWRGRVVEVVVEDRGPGIPVEERERIFGMFNRVQGGGRAGLGLTIAKAFVEAHGGTIRAEGREGGGARFVFRLPVADVPGDLD
jgi:two-component system sensor histidine kinase KdpD